MAARDVAANPVGAVGRFRCTGSPQCERPQRYVRLRATHSTDCAPTWREMVGHWLEASGYGPSRGGVAKPGSWGGSSDSSTVLSSICFSTGSFDGSFSFGLTAIPSFVACRLHYPKCGSSETASSWRPDITVTRAVAPPASRFLNVAASFSEPVLRGCASGEPVAAFRCEPSPDATWLTVGLPALAEPRRVGKVWESRRLEPRRERRPLTEATTVPGHCVSDRDRRRRAVKAESPTRQRGDETRSSTQSHAFMSSESFNVPGAG